jgi:hypothetical protein
MDDLKDLDELRALVPPPLEEHLSSDRLGRRKEILMREIVRTLGPTNASDGVPSLSSGPRRRLRRRIVGLVLVPAALLGGAVAYSMTANRPANQLGNYVTCFQAPRLDAPAAGSPFAGQDLSAFCNHQWSSGSIQAPPPGPVPIQWVACQSESQGVDVFPSDDQELCQGLGLQPVPPSYYEAVKRYSAVESDLWTRFPETQCVSAKSAIATTRDVLDAHGYSNWTVLSNGFGDLTPCALAPDLDAVNGVATIRGGVRPELLAAVRQGLEQANYCGPEELLVGDVRQSLAESGFGDWTVRIDHQLAAQWPCVAGFNADPATKTIVLAGYATR